MTSTTGQPRRAGTTTGPDRTARAEQLAALRRAHQRRKSLRWGGLAGALLLLAGFLVLVAVRGGGTERPRFLPTVGGDLHTVTAIGDSLYVGGHAAVAVSRDGGGTWKSVASLNNADAMGWAVAGDAVLVGGHPGLFRSTDRGTTFAPLTGAAAVPDVHALGGTGTRMYVASPRAGLLASTDGGQTWQTRNTQVGQSFMGTILVDPSNPDRLVAADMSGGLAASTNGGQTFTPLGGPMGAMAVAWNPTNTEEIIAVGMNGAARSRDGGGSWADITLPKGASALSYGEDGRTVYAGTLVGQQARLYRSTDAGVTWQPTG